MALGCRSQMKQEVVPDENVAAVEAGHRKQAERCEKAAMVGQDVFEKGARGTGWL